MAGFKTEIRQFIVDGFLFGDDKRFGDDDSLLDAGVVDSTGVLEIITHLEGQYQITVENDELIPENLDSIANICAFLERKTTGNGLP